VVAGQAVGTAVADSGQVVTNICVVTLSMAAFDAGATQIAAAPML
jgi:hypothetical protein